MTRTKAMARTAAMAVTIATIATIACAAQDPERPAIDAASLAGRRFEFSWRSEGGGGVNGIATLRTDGRIEGIASPNESTWSLDEEGRLLFRHADRRISTRYDRAWVRDGLLAFEGPFLFRDGIVHTLVEVPGSGPPPQDRIDDETAERIAYSRQRFVYLDPGEAVSFRLRDGTERRVRLESVEEIEDSVIGLARHADVVVSIDGERLELACAPYVMPTETQGLRVQADTTSAWLEMPKRVQLSLWDASDPIVDTDLFRFPLPDYRLFSHGIQAYNEPVHLGDRDGDPDGNRFHHNYGVDLAGYEGRQKVASAIDGTVVQTHRGEGTLSIRDDRGIVLVYGHLDSILSEIREGTRVARGQWVGMLGRRGASGDFSHLHVGIYLSEAAMAGDRMSRNLNLYPWMVAAYRARSISGNRGGSGAEVLAVARPHRAARTGETVVLDGGRSLAFGTRIASWRWVFHDGASASGPRAERIYERPGSYAVGLWVEDDRGARDVDFATVRVYSLQKPEGVIPTIFATFTPAGRVRVGEPVSFRFWPQGAWLDRLRVDFGDGTVLGECLPYTAVSHRFGEPGIHVVAVTAACGDLPVMQKLKVVVEE